MSIRRPAQMILALAIAAVLAVPSAAGARPHTTFIVRDGFWGGLSASNVLGFDVRHHAASHLRFVLALTCHNTQSNTDSQDTFIGGRTFPATPIPSGGLLTVNYTERDANRVGHITIGLDWSHRRPYADISVNTFGDSSHPEDCQGFGVIDLRRGKLHPHPTHTSIPGM